MTFIKCKKHGSIGCSFASEKIADSIRSQDRKIKREDLHLIQIFLDEDVPNFAFWVEKEDLIATGYEIKPIYFSYEISKDPKVFHAYSPICPKCFEELLE